jgi:hypothetical protein
MTANVVVSLRNQVRWGRSAPGAGSLCEVI